jgi:phosphoglycolate phosphatase-like HAD superfamily hydrolase
LYPISRKASFPPDSPNEARVPSPSRLILFDIDGTLLTAGGAPRRAFRRALIAHFGTSGDEARTDFSGKTDPQIVYEIMRRAGFHDDRIEAGIDDLFEHYLEGLERELPRDDSHRLHPGAADLVEALAADARVLLGLVTGNVERGARLKLERFDLWRRFSVGAFGSDDPDRDRLPQIAIERARRLTGHPFTGADAVVIGDSPADIRCARAAGALAVAVASGRPTRAELAACRPDVLLDSLEEWPELLAAIGLSPDPVLAGFS